MRLALISPRFIETPPRPDGGTELFVAAHFSLARIAAGYLDVYERAMYASRSSAQMEA